MEEIEAALGEMDEGNRSLFLDGTCSMNDTIGADSVPKWSKYGALVTWGAIVVIGILGNVTVIYTMGRHGERSATTCYILNLAAADLAFIVLVVPLTIHMYAIDSWPHGDFLCRTVSFLIQVTLNATCLTLTAMTVDRYFAIVHPIRSLRSRTPRAATVVCSAIWLMSCLLGAPFFVYFRTSPACLGRPVVYCRAAWPSPAWHTGSTIAVVVTTYVLPLTVIVVCYSRILRKLWHDRSNRIGEEDGVGEEGTVGNMQDKRRRRVSRMVATVVILFALFWLPIHLFQVVFVTLPDFPKTETMMKVKIAAHSLSYANSCVNPIVYAFIGVGFRRAFRKSLPRWLQTRRVVPAALPGDHGHGNNVETQMTGEPSRPALRGREPVPVGQKF